MRNYFLLLILFTTIVFFTGCFSPTPAQSGYIENKIPLYTQKAVWIKNIKKEVYFMKEPFTKDASILPINTKVVAIAFRRDLVLSYRGRLIKEVRIRNVVDEKGTISDKAKQNYFDNLLSPTKVNINKFTQLEQDNIEINEVDIGMSKDAVLAAIGSSTYPMTFSNKDDKWYYGNMLLLIFKDNKVIKIKDSRILKTHEIKAQ